MARRVNWGWWWHRLGPALVGVNLGGAAALLLFRQLRWPLALWFALVGAAWLIAAGWAWWRARTNFFAEAEGLLRLETYLRWNNILSAAAAGGLRWPGLPAQPIRSLQWQWGKSAQPVLASLAFLLAALVIPVSAPPKPALPPPTQLPPALQQAQTWTDTLKEENLVEPATMESWAERLEQLKQKPQQEWYGQESLEADESLRNQLAQEIDALGKNLKKAADLLDALQNLPAGASLPADLQAALNAEASALQNSNLPMRQELAQMLNNAQNLSPSQLAYLKNQLQQGANGLNSMPTTMVAPGSLMSAQGLAQYYDPNAQAAYHSAQDDQLRYVRPNARGAGATGTGGGTNGLSFASPTDLRAQKQQGVNSKNLNSMVPGDVVGISISAPPREQADGAAAGAGGGASQGDGGEAVWREELTPQERALLQQYFK